MAQSTEQSGSDAPQKPEVRLLVDEPSDADEFAAKAHDQVARAIAELITHEPGGRVIGLEGSWGSGKSTVVRLLTQRLHGDQSPTKDDSGTRAVIFDAWAHQGDPLRRSFLETVISELAEAGWLTSENKKKYLAELSGKASKVRTKTTARLSFEGKLTSAAAAFLPLGAVLASNHFSHHHRTALYAGLVMLLSPLLVVTVLYALKKLASRGDGAKTRQWQQKLAELRPSGFFANEQETNTTTDAIERGEPTSVEFERLFSEVLEAAMSDSRRLLLVLDNLDRVDESDAKTVLATMQTFTSTGSDPSKPWTRCVWTLIPYDPAGLDRLWNPDASGEDEPEAEGGDAPLTSPTATAFIEKVFQARFETPPLVLSDWRGYLRRLLEEALPKEQEDDILSVLRLRALYPSVESRGVIAKEAPTPRQLKQLVNQLGTVRRLRDDVPLVHVAYYSLLRTDRFNVARQLIAGTLPHPRLIHLLSADVQEDLAALHFGTTRSLAQQLLLGGALDQAFAAGDSDSVAPLKDRAGFADALESLDLGSRVADGGIELTRAVAALKASGALDQPDADALFKGTLLRQARTSPSWSLAGRETGTGVAIIFDALSSDDGEALSNLLSKVQSGPREADADGHLQLEGVAGLTDALLALGRSTESLRIQIAIPADRLTSSLAFFGTQTSDVRSRAMLEVGLAPGAVAQELVGTAITENPVGVVEALAVLLARPERVDLAGLEDSSLEWLRSQDPTAAEQLNVLLSILDTVRRSRASEDVLAGPLGAAADDGTLMHFVSFASRNAWHKSAAAASMLHLTVRPDFSAPVASRESTAGTQLLRQSLNDPSVNPDLVAGQFTWLQEHSREAVDLLMRVAADTASKPWVDHHLHELADAGGLIVSPDQYHAGWMQLRAALTPDQFLELTRSLIGKAGTRKKVLAGASNPTLALVLLEATNSEDKASADVRAWASGVVKSAAATDWQVALATAAGGPILDLALSVEGSADAPSDLPGLFDALHSHFRALAAGEAVWQADPTTFAKLTNLLGGPARTVLASELCAELEGQDGNVEPGLFATYGAFLAAEAGFRSHPKLPNFIERAVAHDAWDSVQWIADVAQSHADTLDPTGRGNEIEHLRNRIKEKLGELPEEGAETPQALTTLSDLLGS